MENKAESEIQTEVRLAVCHLGTRLFRNNVGLFTTEGGEKIRTGLCVGSSDLIGWTPLIITQEMVGQKIAVFTACETKSLRGKASGKQKNFVKRVNEAGGIGIVVRSDQEAVDGIKGKFSCVTKRSKKKKGIQQTVSKKMVPKK